MFNNTCWNRKNAWESHTINVFLSPNSLSRNRESPFSLTFFAKLFRQNFPQILTSAKLDSISISNKITNRMKKESLAWKHKHINFFRSMVTHLHYNFFSLARLETQYLLILPQFSGDFMNFCISPGSPLAQQLCTASIARTCANLLTYSAN